jgi:hypothetical protein
MEAVGTKHSRSAMISREEALQALSAAWPGGLTAKEVYFAVRPPVTDDDRAVSGSAYASRAIEGLINEGLVVRDQKKAGRSAIYRMIGKPLMPADEAGLAVREVPHDRGEVALERWLQTAIDNPRGTETTEPLTVAQTGAATAPLGSARRTTDVADRIAAALLRKIQAPKPGSPAEIVKVRSAEGIAWARAAGIEDLAMASEIILATGLDARPEDIVHLVASLPGDARQVARQS